jgi:ADP-heptose:LPS heptosyltransferase
MGKLRTAAMLVHDYLKYRAGQQEKGLQQKYNMVELGKMESCLQIAVRPTGGLGDYIISAKFTDELYQYGPCRIDVYCEKMEFGEAIYSPRPFIRVFPASMYENSAWQYDLAMTVEHFVHINFYNAKKLFDLSPELFRIVEEIREAWDSLYLPVSRQCYREMVHFRQMELLGLDRYTELRMGERFKICDKWSGIYLTKEGERHFKDLKLDGTEYVTCNYGADSMGKRSMQLKVWPRAYYEKLIEKIHAEYSWLRVVQTGGPKAERLQGADICVLGADLETVKWILKGSLCHIDCEGGLVHMATQLATHCIVLFGPTPLAMYGYEQNTNLVNPQCNNCMGIYDQWAFSCFRGEMFPPCMYGITPEEVFEKLRGILNRERGGWTEYMYRPDERPEAMEITVRSGPGRLNRGIFHGSEKYKTFYQRVDRALQCFSVRTVIAISPERDILPALLAEQNYEVLCYDENYGFGNKEPPEFYTFIRRGTSLGIDYRLSSPAAIPRESASADLVLLYGHTASEKHVIRETVRLLRQDGHYILADE